MIIACALANFWVVIWGDYIAPFVSYQEKINIESFTGCWPLNYGILLYVNVHIGVMWCIYADTFWYVADSGAAYILCVHIYTVYFWLDTPCTQNFIEIFTYIYKKKNLDASLVLILEWKVKISLICTIVLNFASYRKS